MNWAGTDSGYIKLNFSNMIEIQKIRPFQNALNSQFEGLLCFSEILSLKTDTGHQSNSSSNLSLFLSSYVKQIYFKTKHA